MTSEGGDEIKVMLTAIGSSRLLEIEIVKLARVIDGAPLRIAVKDSNGTVITLVSSTTRRNVKIPGVAGEESIH
ncbi:hypothetical protein NL533_31235, partial [Klebsiella pneumoniae]|nr:hypothetical protein [Klebsiella pneumoniae]